MSLSKEEVNEIRPSRSHCIAAVARGANYIMNPNENPALEGATTSGWLSEQINAHNNRNSMFDTDNSNSSDLELIQPPSANLNPDGHSDDHSEADSNADSDDFRAVRDLVDSQRMSEDDSDAQSDVSDLVDRQGMSEDDSDAQSDASDLVDRQGMSEDDSEAQSDDSSDVSDLVDRQRMSEEDSDADSDDFGDESDLDESQRNPEGDPNVELVDPDIRESPQPQDSDDFGDVSHLDDSQGIPEGDSNMELFDPDIRESPPPQDSDDFGDVSHLDDSQGIPEGNPNVESYDPNIRESPPPEDETQERNPLNGFDSDNDMEWDTTTSVSDTLQRPLSSANIFDELADDLMNAQRNMMQSAEDKMERARMLDVSVAFRERAWSCEELCSVCFEVVLKTQQVATLPCTHRFHQYCILPWLKKQQTCPNCRKPA